MKKTILVSITLALGCANALAGDKPADAVRTTTAAEGTSTPDANNSGMNVRDKSDVTVTPQDQGENKSDLKLLAAVRSALTDDKNLSVSAHNIKIVAGNGVVTLRGPVESEAEKSRIGRLARSVAGVTSVENHLDIKTN